jgi:hypothetical protein
MGRRSDQEILLGDRPRGQGPSDPACLRGTGILARAEAGYHTDQIANDIDMTRQNVDHYMRFRDQMRVANDGQKRLRLITNEG